MSGSKQDVVVFKVGANLFRGLEAVGGWLHLSTSRIQFQPHAVNVQKQPLEIPMNAILEVRKRKYAKS